MQIMFNRKTSGKIVEISDLPDIPVLRDYIDNFFENKRNGIKTRIAGKEVINAGYGHCTVLG